MGLAPGRALAHLVTDALFYRWPVQWAWPLSRRGVGLGLVGWNDLLPTLLLYAGTAIALLWAPAAMAAAAASLAVLALYLGWRALRAPVRAPWLAWLTGGWARRSPRLCRWLTGDFLSADRPSCGKDEGCQGDAGARGAFGEKKGRSTRPRVSHRSALAATLQPGRSWR